MGRTSFRQGPSTSSGDALVHQRYTGLFLLRQSEHHIIRSPWLSKRSHQAIATRKEDGAMAILGSKSMEFAAVPALSASYCFLSEELRRTPSSPAPAVRCEHFRRRPRASNRAKQHKAIITVHREECLSFTICSFDAMRLRGDFVQSTKSWGDEVMDVAIPPGSQVGRRWGFRDGGPCRTAQQAPQRERR